MSACPHNPSDGDVLAAVLAGESDRFAEIVRRYQTALTRVAASRLGRRDWAEEVVQETFLAAYRWLETYDSRYSFRTWLWTILLNQCTRYWERMQRQPPAGLSAAADSDGSASHAPLAPAEESPPARAAANERRQRLEQLLSTLPAEQADALRLRFFGELKFHEIAAAMQCSLVTAKNRVKLGLLKLSAALSASPSGESPAEFFA